MSQCSMTLRDCTVQEPDWGMKCCQEVQGSLPYTTVTSVPACVTAVGSCYADIFGGWVLT